MATNIGLEPLSKTAENPIAIEPDVVSLADLKPTNMNKLIEVKVYRKWTDKSLPDLIPTTLCFNY